VCVCVCLKKYIISDFDSKGDSLHTCGAPGKAQRVAQTDRLRWCVRVRQSRERVGGGGHDIKVGFATQGNLGDVCVCVFAWELVLTSLIFARGLRVGPQRTPHVSVRRRRQTWTLSAVPGPGRTSSFELLFWRVLAWECVGALAAQFAPLLNPAWVCLRPSSCPLSTHHETGYCCCHLFN